MMGTVGTDPLEFHILTPCFETLSKNLTFKVWTLSPDLVLKSSIDFTIFII